MQIILNIANDRAFLVICLLLLFSGVLIAGAKKPPNVSAAFPSVPVSDYSIT
jgi:hypothetical protein